MRQLRRVPLLARSRCRPSAEKLGMAESGRRFETATNTRYAAHYFDRVIQGPFGLVEGKTTRNLSLLVM